MIVDVDTSMSEGYSLGRTSAVSVPRGIRNRNPGNIRRSGDRWKGLAPLQTDPAFSVFETPVWGIRAMAVILRNYQKRYGLKSLAQLIGRWARQPPKMTRPAISRP